MCKFWSLLTIVVMSCLLAPAWADPDDPFDESCQARPDAADGSLLRPEMQPPQDSKGTSPAPAPAPASRPAPNGAARVSNVLEFDGKSTYVDLGHALDFSKDSAFSVSFWMKSTGGNRQMTEEAERAERLAWSDHADFNLDQQIIVGKSAGFLDHSAPGWAVFTANGGFLYFQLNAAREFRSSELQARELNTRLCDGQWHHVVVAYNGNQDSSGVAFYIDGTDQALGIDSNSLRDGDIRNEVHATIGATAGPTAGVPGTPAHRGLYPGALNEMQVFDRALTADDAAKLYADGKGNYGAVGVRGLAAGYHLDEGHGTTVADFSGHGNTGTLQGSVAWTQGKTAAAPHAHAMPFDGTRYATLPQSTKFTSGDFTISLWFDPASAADRILFMRGFAYRDQQGDIGLKVNLANGDLDFEARTADSRWIFGWDAPQSLLHSPFKLKEWNHVVVTRNGESYAMWMNGVKVRTAPRRPISPTPTTATRSSSAG